MQGWLLLLTLATVMRLSPWELRYRASLEKGPEEAVRLLRRSLHSQHPELESAIRLAAELGPAARSLWPQLVRILETGDPLDQGAAAKAIGWIGAREGIPALAKALADRNWNVALSAADSLGGFGGEAREALAALKQAEKSHWMGYVRQRAALARTTVERGASPTPGPDADHRRKHFWEEAPGDFWEDMHVVAKNDTYCEMPNAVTALRIGARWFAFMDGARQREVAKETIPPVIARRADLAGVTAALAVDKGWLVGTNRGRKGGDLRFVPPKGRSIVIWSEPVRALTAVGPTILAIAADTPWSAEVVELTPDKKAHGGWTARRLVQLPGQDYATLPLSDERMMVLTRAGTVSVGLDGSIREEKCPDEYVTEEVGAPDVEAAAGGHPLPAAVSGIRDSAVRNHVDDAVVVLSLVLNHPRVVPFFHLDRAGSTKPRVLELPALLPAQAIKVAGREIDWVKALATDRRAGDFRFLDLDFESPTAASVAFACPGEGMEGYAVAAKQDGVWRLAGLHVVER
jgi:hypothetical protein